MTKACRTCGIDKPFSEYPMVNPIPSECKECSNQRRRRNYYSDPDKSRLKSREKYYRYKMTADYKNNQVIRQRKVRREKPAQYSAWNKVRRAVRLGRIIRGACAKCGWIGKTQAHHEDYSKPLDVVWLCPPCHRKHHGTQID